MVPKPPPLPHDVSPFLQYIREILLGRIHNSALRFPERISSRSQPPPDLPEGINHKFAENYYCTRDGRRSIMPNEIIVDTSMTGKAIASASSTDKSESAVTVTTNEPKIPGKLYLPQLKESH